MLETELGALFWTRSKRPKVTDGPSRIHLNMAQGPNSETVRTTPHKPFSGTVALILDSVMHEIRFYNVYESL